MDFEDLVHMIIFCGLLLALTVFVVWFIFTYLPLPGIVHIVLAILAFLAILGVLYWAFKEREWDWWSALS